MKRVLLLVGIVSAMCASMVAATPEERTVNCGTTVTIRANAKAHYHFTYWSDGDMNAERQVTVDEAMTLTAYFQEDDMYALYLGSTDDSLGEVVIISETKERYYVGEEVTIRAIPSDACRKFLYWYDDPDNTNPVRTITIGSMNSYVAVFELSQYNLTIQSADDTMGSVEFVY